MSFYRWHGPDLHLDVKVQPRARADQIIGRHNNRLKIRIKAPPVDGKANLYLCQFIASICRLPKHRVKIIAGEQNTLKTVCVENADKLPSEIFHALLI